MRRLDPGVAAVGIAHSDYALALVKAEPTLLDFVEVPFEQLVAAPRAAEISAYAPVVLHCASLSMAGNAEPEPAVVDLLAHWIAETGTPWLGEHLAYVRADGLWRELAEHTAFAPAGQAADAERPGGPGCFNVGYTVSPQLSEPILERVAAANAAWESRLGLPVLLENGPMYFSMPGSTFSQAGFLSALCAASPERRLLLDLAHLACTCANMRLEPTETLDALPLERVVEVHISGAGRQSGVMWDDHTRPASPLVFELLERLLARVMPRAVTLEYNWDGAFPLSALRADVARVRGMVEAAAAPVAA